MRHDEDREMTSAFVAALETLPESFQHWESWFAEVPPAPEAYQDALRQQAMVIDARPYTDGLVVFGLTPSTFVEASRGIELLARRLIRDARSLDEQRPHEQPALMALNHRLRQQIEAAERPSLIVSCQRQPLARPGCIPHPLMISQLQGTPGCPPEAAAPLLRWLVQVAQLKPFLVAGFQANVLGEGEIELTEEPFERHVDLVWRWGRHTEESPLWARPNEVMPAS